MSLIESARDFVKGLVPTGPEVGQHDTASGTGAPPEVAAADADAVLDDEVARMRREWDSQPGHL